MTLPDSSASTAWDNERCGPNSVTIRKPLVSLPIIPNPFLMPHFADWESPS